jgi:hypothetical protein
MLSPPMSFFDEDDEPRRTARSRGGSRAATARTTDSQTLLIRRIVAVGAIAVVLVLLAVAINSCRNSQQRNGLKDYTGHVNSVGTESQQVGQQFFRLLNRSGGQSPQDLQTAISSFRVQAGTQLSQAQNFDVPDQMKGAQQSLLIALEQRRDGLDYIAQRIRTALGDDGAAADGAIRQISGQMSAFLASDVLYQGRVRPMIQRVLSDQEIGGQSVARSRFLPDVAWLSPTYVAQKLDQNLASGTSGTTNGQPTGPGLHGTGLDSTSFGTVTLQPGVANRLTYTAGTGFAVKFTNQGDNDEFDVRVTVRITGGGSPITLTRTVPKIAKGASATPTLALTRTPPIGSAVTISVAIAPVPGEKKTDNNRSQYNAIFQRG